MDSKEFDPAVPYLTDWKKIIGNDNELKTVRWISGGSKDNESMVISHMVKMEKDLLVKYPDLDSVIYTNSVDIQKWSGSKIVSIAGKHFGHNFERSLFIAESMMAQEGLIADLYICNGAAPALSLYSHLAWYNRPVPPIICIFALAPRHGELWSYTPPKSTVDFFRFAGIMSTFWVVVVDKEERSQ